MCREGVAFVTHRMHYCRMVKKKTATLNLRIDPVIKEALKAASDREHRSIANMVEMLIREHCAKTGHSIPTQTSLFGNEHGQ